MHADPLGSTEEVTTRWEHQEEAGMKRKIRVESLGRSGSDRGESITETTRARKKVVKEFSALTEVLAANRDLSRQVKTLGGIRDGVNQQKPKIILFDLECTSLNANFGYLLCFGYKELGDKGSKVISITDFPEFKKDVTNDYYLVKAAGDILRDADMVIGWYSTRFDWPWVQSRLIAHRLPVLPPIQHVDGWRIAKYKMKLNSNRLASVQAFLDVEEKTPLSGPIWIRAAAGHKGSIDYVKAHCFQDVETLEQVYERIKPLCTNHPSVGLMAGNPYACPICGGSKLQRRGYHLTRTRRYQRYQCQACGGWSNDGQLVASTVLR